MTARLTPAARLRKFVHDHPGALDLPTAVSIQTAIAEGKKIHFKLLEEVLALAEQRRPGNTSELLRMVATHDERQLRNDDVELQDFLRHASRLLGGHGVESFADSENEVYFTYVNAGDSYRATLAHDGDKLLVTTYGGWIEWAETARRPRLKFS